ncbi:response regulator [Ulvibacter litoralis]|nr:response regulator [Ulvibacter litoralis]
MLIDDNKINLFVTQKIIENSGIAANIKSFDSAIVALDFLKNIEETNTFQTKFIPDIILLDINMPEMNGTQFLSAFNKVKSIQNSQTCIYIVSSSIDPEDIKSVTKEVNCKGYIEKPITSEKFNKILVNYRPYLGTYDYQEVDINLDVMRKTS